MKAIKIKSWCIDNITPQSWSRIVLRALPELRKMGLELKEVENPNEDLELSEEAIAILDRVMNDLYELSIDAEIME